MDSIFPLLLKNPIPSYRGDLFVGAPSRKAFLAFGDRLGNDCQRYHVAPLRFNDLKQGRLYRNFTSQRDSAHQLQGWKVFVMAYWIKTVEGIPYGYLRTSTQQGMTPTLQAQTLISNGLWNRSPASRIPALKTKKPGSPVRNARLLKFPATASPLP